MKKLSEQELEVLQQMIVDEGWMPVSEKQFPGFYRAHYKINDTGYILVKDNHGVEGWEVD